MWKENDDDWIKISRKRKVIERKELVIEGSWMRTRWMTENRWKDDEESRDKWTEIDDGRKMNETMTMTMMMNEKKENE